MLQQKNELKKYLFTVILCAGEGLRLKEFTRHIPKPLIRMNALNNKSILHYTINSLLKLSVNRIAIIKGYLGYKIDEFIEKLVQKHPALKEKLFLVDAKEVFKLGPLYSFLSITKNKNIFQTNYTYLIIPGDTIFQYQLLKEIFSFIQKNFKIIQKHPIIFFRKIEGNFLKLKKQSKLVSVANIKKRNMQDFLKKIEQVHINNISSPENINQLIPIFLFSYNFITEIINIEKKISIKTIREAVNYLIKQGKRIYAIKIDSHYNFYDIDTKLDLIEFENLQEKKKGTIVNSEY